MDGKKIGTFLKTKIKEMGITQEAFAEVLGISASAVSQNLSGDSMFSPENLMKISNYLNISIDSILRAGERSETEIEKAVKGGLDAFINLHKKGYMVAENDANGKTAIDYAIQYDMIDIARYIIANNLYKGGIHQNPYYIALLIRHNDETLLQANYHVDNAENATYQGTLGVRIVFPSYFQHQYEISNLLSSKNGIYQSIPSPGRAIIDALFSSNNDNIWGLSGYFTYNRMQRENSNGNGLAWMAIELDNVNALTRILKLNRGIDKEELLKYAVKNKSMATTKYLIDGSNPYELLMKTVESNDYEFFNAFYSKIERINFPITFIVSKAVKLGNKDIVKILLNNVDQNTKNAALREVNENDIEMVNLLLDLGARFSIHVESDYLQEVPGLTTWVNSIRSKK